MVRDAMQGLLRSWGCMTVAAESESDALAGLAAAGRGPDLVISDYRLAHGLSGFDLIDRFKHQFGARLPVFLVSGDTAPERLREALAGGYRLLHKPVSPVTLRAMVGSFLKQGSENAARRQEELSV
jgi:CheY-like chemotaxis protein